MRPLPSWRYEGVSNNKKNTDTHDDDGELYEWSLKLIKSFEITREEYESGAYKGNERAST